MEQYEDNFDNYSICDHESPVENFENYDMDDSGGGFDDG